MNVISDALAIWLAPLIGLTAGTDVFSNHLPEAPDLLVSLLENPGGMPIVYTMGSAPVLVYATVQVFARGTVERQESSALIVAAYKAFIAHPAMTTAPWTVAATGAWAPGTLTILSLAVRSYPLPFDRDSSGRLSHAFDLDLTARLTP